MSPATSSGALQRSAPCVEHDGEHRLKRVGVDAQQVLIQQGGVDQIERCLADVDNLSEVEGDTRHHLVWALGKITFHPDSFEDGARLLLRLVVAENETWDNNATGQFRDLFPMLLGNTAADGNARLSVLDEAAETNDARQLAIVVDALIAGSGIDHFSRFLGPESHGSRLPLESWRPATDKEAASYVQGCVTRLAEFAARDDEAGRDARVGLGRNLRGLVGSGFIDVVETVVRQMGTAAGYWPEALEGLDHFLRYDAGKMGQEVTQPSQDTDRRADAGEPGIPRALSRDRNALGLPD